MAITWGAKSGRLQVGIDVTTSAYDTNTTAITVTVRYYYRVVEWRYNDNQRYHWNGSTASGYIDFTNSQGSAGTYEYLIKTHTFSQAISYSGGPTRTFSASISGAYDGSSPSVSRSWTAPARPANVPTAPGLSVGSVTNNSARLTVSAADGRGSTIVEYQTQHSQSSTFASGVTTLSGGTKTITGLSAATRYYARARARNGVGWGGWSTTRSFVTGATVPSAPGSPTISNVTEDTAQLAWTTPYDGGSDIDDYTIQVATNSSFSAGLKSWDDAASPLVMTGLTPGVTHYARVRANNAVGASGWSSTVSFTTLTGTPVVTGPTSGQILTTGIASATVLAKGITTSRIIRVQFSQSSTFASGITELTLTSPTKTSNDRYVLTDATKKLRNGTWYVRSNVTNTSTNYTTPWSSTVSFTQSHTPSAAVQSPTASEIARYTGSISLTWRFNDPAHPNDTQSAYRIIIENNATAELVYDSGKVAKTTTAANQNATVSVPIDPALKNVVLRWKVMVWDSHDQASSYSGWGLFSLSDPPVVTLVSPAPGLSVDTGAPTFSWEFVSPAGGTQQLAQVKVFDSATNREIWRRDIAGETFQVTPTQVILSNNKSYYFTVTATDTANLSSTSSSAFTTSYDAPAGIPYEIDASMADTNGYVLLDWSQATADPLFSSWKIYRQETTDEPEITDWTLIAEIVDQNVRQYKDFMLQSGEEYVYSVTQTATRSGEILESTVGYRLDLELEEEVTEDRTFGVDLTTYWLIDPDNDALSLNLVNVISDSSVLEFESETYTIIGRGRHRDYGDELGYTGTLVCQVRTAERISSFRKKIEALRRSNETYYLRTPFGRLFPVALGNLSWEPLAGTGITEMGQMSIPYEEVGE